MNKCGVKVEHLLDAIKSVEKNGNVQRKDFHRICIKVFGKN